MQKRFYPVIVPLWILAASPLVCSAADDGWKMPNLNPFATKAKPPTASRVGNPPTTGWRMPKLLPSTAPAKKKANQPTTWNKMTGSTQQFFSKTANALNPWDDKPAKPPPKITGSNTIFTHNNAPKQEPKSSSINPASWWSSQKEPAKGGPKSVNDFLSQERPH